MDPVSAIGLAGALVGIGDVITRSLRRLVDLQSKYRSSSLVVSLLIGQLTTLKAALNQITEWATSSLVGVLRHEQLMGDLQVSLESCHVLIFILEERIEKLELEQDGGSLSVKGKIGFLLEENGLNEFTTHLNHQVNALNLLLTALNCRSTFERNEVLCSNESRQIFKQIKDNRTSLLSLRDTESLDTRRSIATSDNWSLVERAFDFDQEVITTGVYRAALRFNMRKAASSTEANMPWSNDNFLEAMPEAAGEAPEGVPYTQAQRRESTFTQPDWPLQSLLPLLRIEEQPPNEEIVELEDAGYMSDQQSRGSEQEASLIPLRIDVSKEVSIESTERALPIPDAFRFRPLDRRRKSIESIERDLPIPHAFRFRPLDRRRKSIWRSWIPKPFATPSSLDEQKPIASQDQMSPSANPAKILLLGTSCSGKTTLLKSIAQACGDYWTLEARLSFKDTIFSNTVHSMRAILKAMESLEENPDHLRSEDAVRTIFMQPDFIEGEYLAPEVCEAIETLWEDGGVRRAFERSTEYDLHDNAAYTFNSVRRFADPEYIPTDVDILMARLRTTGISETCLESNGIKASFYDPGGMRSERKKWIHCFEKAYAVVFAVDIAAYDQVLFEDETANRSQEDLNLFQSIINSRWFTNTPFILLFTKMDKLEAKLEKSPIDNYYVDFEGAGTDVEDVKAYIEARFLSLDEREPKKDIEVVYTSFLEEHEVASRVVLNCLAGLLPTT